MMKDDEIVKKIVDSFLRNKEKIRTDNAGRFIYLAANDFFIVATVVNYDSTKFSCNFQLGSGTLFHKDAQVLKMIFDQKDFNDFVEFIRLWKTKALPIRSEYLVKLKKDLELCLDSFD